MKIDDVDVSDGFASGLVSFARQVDGRIGLQRQDAELQFGAVFRQTPETVEERSAVIEVISNELAVGIEAGAVATISDTKK
jgi:hypothetical protein